MDKDELMINIESKEGKSRRIKSKKSFLCIGVLDLSKESQQKAAIKLTDIGEWYIDKFRCSKCYLCKLKSNYIYLDEQHFPVVGNKVDKKTYELTPADQIHFESNLARYKEEAGISKWIYSIFRLFGISETFSECAISKELIPRDILEKLGELRTAGVYSKSVIPDVEGNTDEFVFVFENKRYSTEDDDWIVKAIKQIILYSSSKIYQEKKGNVVFIFSYTGSYNIRDRVAKIINQHEELKIIYDIFNKKQNYKLVLLPSSEIFKVIYKALKEGKKEKAWIIDTILNNVIDLPSE